VPTYVEPDTGKVFPQSDRSSDVLAVLVRRLKSAGCELATSEPLVDVEVYTDEDCDSAESGFRLTTSKRILHADKLLLATGGKSYPDCGTTGDGYRFAEKLGHTIIPPRPALAPISTNSEPIRALQGITLPDVLVRVIDRGADCQSALSSGQVGNLPHEKSRGAMLFAHFGVTGPAVMDISRRVSEYPTPSELILDCDLLPDCNENKLEQSIAKECAASGKRTVSTLLDPWLPHRVGETILQTADIPSTGV